ncbi:hypothetical protein FOE78_12215 [Microlunatus elymi]|uniref:Uncharacterized protein n=2 Tax=Microlunatus elymi TaxID=2596828 RepID=A0A516Q5W8_9ACTN|nr:hypothetical protein FOE78_12215 [Microlunatus elymi]
MRKEISTIELDTEYVELLPERETLFFNFNWANVYASNSSIALNAGSLLANAQASANQAVVVSQG